MISSAVVGGCSCLGGMNIAYSVGEPTVGNVAMAEVAVRRLGLGFCNRYLMVKMLTLKYTRYQQRG